MQSNVRSTGLPGGHPLAERGTREPGAGLSGLKLGTVGLAGVWVFFLLTVAWAATKPPLDRDVIELEDIRAEIRAGQSLAYEIQAKSGLYATDSRTVTLMGPQVLIYDKQGNLQDRVQGSEGRMWPVPAVITQEDGTTVVVTKYNWSLRGDVVFQSQQGYRLKTPELFFDHESSEIRSESGISYLIPTGKGGVFEGTAEEFRSVLGEGASRLQNWSLSGQVQLKMRDEK